MNHRTEILARLPRTASEMPAPGTYRREYPDLAGQFANSLQAAKGEVYRADDLAAAFQKLRDLFEALQVRTVAAHLEPPLDDPALPASFPLQSWHFAGQVEDYRAVCADADAGLTSAAFGLAETGSLVLAAGPTHSRLSSLLPPIHCVLLPESRIVPSIFDWAAQRPESFPSNLVLVSGPSKTADIEQTLVVGVHGPRRLVVVVYPDRD